MAGDAASFAAQPRLPMGIKLAHGVGSIAYGVKEVGFSTFLLIYFNQVLGYDARLVSLALVAALLVDAVIDPLIGHLTDRTNSRWGRRLPWLYIAPIPLAIVWAMLWSPPAWAPHSILFLFVMAVLVRALVSACEVPSVALVPELTKDYDERTGLVRFRFLFGWFGGLFTSVMAYVVFLKPTTGQPNGLLNPDGYAAFGLFGAVLMAVTVIVSAIGQHRYVVNQNEPLRASAHGANPLKAIGQALRHKAFLPLMVAGLFVFTGQGVTFVITNYLFLYVWNFSETMVKIYPAGLMIGVVTAFLLVGHAHRRLGKKKTAILAALFTLIAWITPFILRFAGFWPEVGGAASSLAVLLFFALSTIGNVLVTMSSSSMVADVVEAHEAETGVRSEGTFYACNFLVNKCSSALGIFLTGQIVAFAGLSERTDPASVGPQVVATLSLLICCVIVISGLCAAFAYRFYPITREDHAARLAARSAQGPGLAQ